MQVQHTYRTNAPKPGRCSVVRTPQRASIPAAEPIVDAVCMALTVLMGAVAASYSRFLSIISFPGVDGCHGLRSPLSGVPLVSRTLGVPRMRVPSDISRRSVPIPRSLCDHRLLAKIGSLIPSPTPHSSSTPVVPCYDPGRQTPRCRRRNALGTGN